MGIARYALSPTTFIRNLSLQARAWCAYVQILRADSFTQLMAPINESTSGSQLQCITRIFSLDRLFCIKIDDFTLFLHSCFCQCTVLKIMMSIYRFLRRQTFYCDRLTLRIGTKCIKPFIENHR